MLPLNGPVIPAHPLDLRGRWILITGASSGIGQATALLLSELQARLVLVGRNAERLEATHQQLTGEGHRLELFDLNALAEIPGWLKRIAAETGPLAGLVHCAGLHSLQPVRLLRPEQLEAVLRINVSAAMMLAKAFCQKGCGGPGSSIVLVSSVSGLVGRPGVTAYSASKGAIAALARSLALELARDRIRVNCVAPGLVQGGMFDQLRELMAPEQIAAVEALHPLGLGTPRDVAYAIAFLLGDTARWITGTTLVVDGGYTAQ